ncbi:CheR family methyltransferase [Natronospora cellulosivora (SeqCode)]
MTDINNNQFNKFQKLIYDKYGIYLAPNKQQMIQGRLRKVMRVMGLADYNDLYNALINNDKKCWLYFDHEVTTHKTDFFRENNHFQFIGEKSGEILAKNKRILFSREIRVWSAGCSTGEEPYTLAMVLKEHLPRDISIKILATDISSQVIAKAQTGIYLQQDEQIASFYLKKYFRNKDKLLKINEEIKELITFRTFNLMDPFPFQNQFDIIFCRNVMIYFDYPVQVKLLKKFYNSLVPGALFFIGHSESLSQKQYKFKYIQPTIYSK